MEASRSSSALACRGAARGVHGGVTVASGALAGSVAWPGTDGGRAQPAGQGDSVARGRPEGND